jgi:hypothetical protein
VTQSTQKLAHSATATAASLRGDASLDVEKLQTDATSHLLACHVMWSQQLEDSISQSRLFGLLTSYVRELVRVVKSEGVASFLLDVFPSLLASLFPFMAIPVFPRMLAPVLLELQRFIHASDIATSSNDSYVSILNQVLHSKESQTATLCTAFMDIAGTPAEVFVVVEQGSSPTDSRALDGYIVLSAGPSSSRTTVHLTGNGTNPAAAGDKKVAAPAKGAPQATQQGCQLVLHSAGPPSDLTIRVHLKDTIPDAVSSGMQKVVCKYEVTHNNAPPTSGSSVFTFRTLESSKALALAAGAQQSASSSIPSVASARDSITALLSAVIGHASATLIASTPEGLPELQLQHVLNSSVSVQGWSSARLLDPSFVAAYQLGDLSMASDAEFNSELEGEGAREAKRAELQRLLGDCSWLLRLEKSCVQARGKAAAPTHVALHGDDALSFRASVLALMAALGR